jgi:dTDP-4-dehydrorhamnose 3,5-epimerase
MHWQAEPSPEIKLVRCSRGAIWDVLVDVRKGSQTFGLWEAFELSAENHRELYVPAGVAHGFQCLENESEVTYWMGATFAPELARGLRWNDPTVGIRWPIENPHLSLRDRELPLLDSL